MGAELTLLPVDGEGRIDLAAAEAAMRAGASLASIMLANNEVGTLQPVAELAAEARENQIPFHTDAVQAAGKIPIDVRKLGVDLLSLSAHKLHGPKGVGALFVRKGTKLAPISFGGHQERGLRPGTENVPAIAGFGKACELAAQRLEADARRIAELRDQLERAVLEQVPGATVNAAGAPRLPNTSNVSFEGLDMLAATGDHPAEPLDDARGGLRQPSAGVLDVAPGTPALPASTASLSGRRLPVQSAMSDRGSTRSWLDGGMLAINLDLLGVAVSTGSACGTRASEISHVLLAMGRTEEQARAAVRFSLGRGNTAEEIRRAVELIRQAVLAMRNAR
jgi:cysteine sulfinate desulfinase/cysteine desulfurase-like protein